jgi:hypothetical protein
LARGVLNSIFFLFFSARFDGVIAFSAGVFVTMGTSQRIPFPAG